MHVINIFLVKERREFAFVLLIRLLQIFESLFLNCSDNHFVTSSVCNVSQHFMLIDSLQSTQQCCLFSLEMQCVCYGQSFLLLFSFCLFFFLLTQHFWRLLSRLYNSSLMSFTCKTSARCWSHNCNAVRGRSRDHQWLLSSQRDNDRTSTAGLCSFVDVQGGMQICVCESVGTPST